MDSIYGQPCRYFWRCPVLWFMIPVKLMTFPSASAVLCVQYYLANVSMLTRQSKAGDYGRHSALNISMLTFAINKLCQLPC